jgi:hypothetical protein
MKNVLILSAAGRFLSARPLRQGACSALFVGFISISLPVVTSRAHPEPGAPAQAEAAKTQQTEGVKPPAGERACAAMADARSEKQVTEPPARLKAQGEAEVNAEAITAKTQAAIAAEIARRRAHQLQLQALQAAAHPAGAAPAPNDKQEAEPPARLQLQAEAEVNAGTIVAKTNAAIALEVARRRAHLVQMQAQQAAADQAREALALTNATRELGAKPVLSDGKYAGPDKTPDRTP